MHASVELFSFRLGDDGQLVRPRKGIGKPAGRAALEQETSMNALELVRLIAHPGGDLDAQQGVFTGSEIEKLHLVACGPKAFVDRGAVNETSAALSDSQLPLKKAAVAEAAEGVGPG